MAQTRIQEAIIKVGNSNSRLYGALNDHVLADIDDALSYRKKGVEHSKKVIEGKWDGVSHCFDRYQKVFPSGLLKEVRRVLKMHEVKVILQDRRNAPIPSNSWHIEFPEGRSFWDFQQETIDKMLSATRGIAAMPTGSGKTVTFGGIIAELGTTPTVVYVPSHLLLKQTKMELENFLRDSNGEPVKVGMVGDGKCDIQDITVMTIQTAVTAFDYEYNRNKDCVIKLTREQIEEKQKEILLKKKKKRSEEVEDLDESYRHLIEKRTDIRELIQESRLIICDECHRASSTIYQAVLRHSMSAYYRYAFSATAYREDGTDMLIQASFGKKIVEYSCSEMIRRGVLVRPYIYMVNVPDTGMDFETYDQAHKLGIVKNQQRNEMIAEIAEQVKTIGPTLLLVQQIPHGRALQKMIDGSEFIYSQTAESRKSGAIQSLLKGELPVLIATPIADEGLNLVQLKCLLLCDSGKAATKLYQRVGRSLRRSEGKDWSLVVDFRDANGILYKHSMERRGLYLKEDEFVMVDVTPQKWDAIMRA